MQNAQREKHVKTKCHGPCSYSFLLIFNFPNEKSYFTDILSGHSRTLGVEQNLNTLCDISHFWSVSF